MSELRDKIIEFNNKKGKAISERYMEFRTRDDGLVLWAVPGHFATSQSHINYYIDVTSMKVRLKEAKAAAREMRHNIMHDIDTIDTIVCMDGTEVLGAFLAQELEKGDFQMTNAHETIYICQPEENSVHQFMFRENVKPAIQGKNVIVLVDTASTGETVRRSADCIEYYGGKTVGVGGGEVSL